MAKHAAPRRRPQVSSAFRSRKGRALLSLGLVVGISAPGTLAFWSDSVTMTGGPFSSGSLDVQLDNNTTTWTNTAMSLENMVPGESVATDFPVQNKGTVDFTYTATGTAAGELSPHLTFEVFLVTTGTATNSPVGGLRTGTCPGASQGAAATLIPTANVIANPQTVASGASQSVCILARLATDTPASMQGKNGSGTFVFTASQLGAS